MKVKEQKITETLPTTNTNNKKLPQISFNKLYVSDNLNKETNLNKKIR